MDARIAADKIKQSISCVQLLSANGIQVNRHGFCICPFHGDSDASMKIYGNSWYCFGCHKGGDIISLEMGLHGIGFVDALKQLNDEFSVGLDFDSEVSSRDKALFAFRKAIAETKRKREKLREQFCEDRYLNSLSMCMWLDKMVQDNEPDPDDEWSPLFRGYIQIRAAAKEQLIESEVRRMMLNE